MNENGQGRETETGDEVDPVLQIREGGQGHLQNRGIEEMTGEMVEILDQEIVSMKTKSQKKKKLKRSWK